MRYEEPSINLFDYNNATTFKRNKPKRKESTEFLQIPKCLLRIKLRRKHFGIGTECPLLFRLSFLFFIFYHRRLKQSIALFNKPKICAFFPGSHAWKQVHLLCKRNGTKGISERKMDETIANFRFQFTRIFHLARSTFH